MIPNIIFRYSWIYDESYRNSSIIKKKLDEKGLEYPSIDKIRRFIKEITPKWKKIEKEVLSKISEITGLKWKEKETICYVIGYGRPFSDPLTIGIYESSDTFIDNLVHEMIHQIQIQNFIGDKWGKYLDKNYKNESNLTRNHIIVHAVHKKIYLTLFNKERLDEDIKKSQLSIDYKKSWDIVEKEGYDEIINNFKKIVN